MPRSLAALLVAFVSLAALPQPAPAEDIKLLTAGAMRGLLVEVLPSFEQETGHKVAFDNGTAGALAKRIEDGESFDLVILTPAAIDALIAKGKLAPGSRADIAKVGIGVAAKAGAALPDIKTVDAFKHALLAASSVAYIDPKGGGSSGIYVDGLLERLGIADVVRAKARLKQGGYVAELVASGDAEIAVHQISEILPVQGVVLVGPLPAEIQSYTTYAAALAPGANAPGPAKSLVDYLTSSSFVRARMRTKGMEYPGR